MSGESIGQPVRCRLTLEFDSSESAEKVQRSVELDNLGYLESRVEENKIVADIEAESIKSLLHTVDDFLACTSVASKIVSKKL
jgi:tRNA threonylcarbamoyladenosine modification (KEOPS) complex  Pcc1 subunit